jgi:hypothetical protein
MVRGGMSSGTHRSGGRACPRLKPRHRSPQAMTAGAVALVAEYRRATRSRGSRDVTRLDSRTPARGEAPRHAGTPREFQRVARQGGAALPAYEAAHGRPGDSVAWDAAFRAITGPRSPFVSCQLKPMPR